MCRMLLIFFSLILVFLRIDPIQAAMTSITFDECPLGVRSSLDWDDCPAIVSKNVRFGFFDKIVRDPPTSANQALDTGALTMIFQKSDGSYYQVQQVNMELRGLDPDAIIEISTRDRLWQTTTTYIYNNGPSSRVITVSGDIRQVTVTAPVVGSSWKGIVDNIFFGDRAVVSPEYAVSFDLFIPGNYAVGSIAENCRYRGNRRQLYFAGDARSFQYAPISFRGKHTLTVIPDVQGSASGLKPRSLQTQVGASRGYAPDALANRRIGPEDDDFIFGDCVLLHNVSTAKSTEMKVQTVRIGPKKVQIKITGALGNPLITYPLCCKADWDVTLIVDASGAQPRWSVTGKHDGFPAYEIYIGRQRIYGYTPGPGPHGFSQIAALGPPMDINMGTRSGVIVP